MGFRVAIYIIKAKFSFHFFFIRNNIIITDKI